MLNRGGDSAGTPRSASGARPNSPRGSEQMQQHMQQQQMAQMQAQRRVANRPGFSPPRSASEKDQLIEKLVHDNEVLMKEVADLDAQLRQAVEEREAAVAANAALLQEQEEQQSTSQIGAKLLKSMESQVEMVRQEREENAAQHAADRDFLNNIFTELEAQLSLARTEREETHTRSERERKGAAKRIKELEEQLAQSNAQKERIREQCDREKEVLAKQFEQRVAGLRLEKEQAKLDKGLMKRLEKDLGELKALSNTILGEKTRDAYAAAPMPPGPRDHYASFGRVDEPLRFESEAATGYRVNM